jgi:four helix bundle protein
VIGGWWVSFVSETVRSYKDLRVWHGAMDLVEAVYRLSAALPVEETYGLKSQMRRAAVSIPSNIAEGQARASTKEFLNHFSMTQASLAEVETQLEIAVRLKYVTAESAGPVAEAIQSVGKQLHGLRNSLEARR